MLRLKHDDMIIDGKCLIIMQVSRFMKIIHPCFTCFLQQSLELHSSFLHFPASYTYADKTILKTFPRPLCYEKEEVKTKHVERWDLCLFLSIYLNLHQCPHTITES